MNNGAATGQTNAFITKMNATGTALVYSTYLGGSGLSSFGVGGARSTPAPRLRWTPMATRISPGRLVDRFSRHPGSLPNDSQRRCSPGRQRLCRQVEPRRHGARLLHVFGWKRASTGTGVAADAFGNAYIAGYAASSFPVSSTAFQTTNESANGYNAFITKLNPVGSGLFTPPTWAAAASVINQSYTLGGAAPRRLGHRHRGRQLR